MATSSSSDSSSSGEDKSRALLTKKRKRKDHHHDEKKKKQEKKRRKRRASTTSTSSSSDSSDSETKLKRLRKYKRDRKKNKKGSRRKSSHSEDPLMAGASSSHGETEKKKKKKRRVSMEIKEKAKKTKKKDTPHSARHSLGSTDSLLPSNSKTGDSLPSVGGGPSTRSITSQSSSSQPNPSEAKAPPTTVRSYGPITQSDHQKKQSIVRRVVDPDTGRSRLVKGDGEIIEEIVSRDRHRAINKLATQGDGLAFQTGLRKTH